MRSQRRHYVAALSLAAICGLALLLWTQRPSVDAIAEKWRTADAEVGSVLFQKHCINCHTGFAPRLRGAINRARESNVGIRYLIESIVYPESVVVPQPTMKRSLPMPYFDFSEREIANLVRYMIESHGR